MDNTLQEFDRVVAECKDIFISKMHDYGVAWRILRLPSVTDQIYIKAQRIRNVEEKGINKINEDITSELRGVVNYALIAQMQFALEPASFEKWEIPSEEVMTLYDKYVENARNLLADKNHDYDQAWRNMRISSLTDIILMKILRIKQIENNQRQTLISEGVDANYYDILNYAIFALIKLTPQKQ
ncbi:MAG: DUF1599 domain-containing protein [Bacteroidales bacterium]|jgi:hypothetical protein|nr:DUF1599 domain-containing protein [Bacteroidales bacterium]